MAIPPSDMRDVRVGTVLTDDDDVDVGSDSFVIVEFEVDPAPAASVERLCAEANFFESIFLMNGDGMSSSSM